MFRIPAQTAVLPAPVAVPVGSVNLAQAAERCIQLACDLVMASSRRWHLPGKVSEASLGECLQHILVRAILRAEPDRLADVVVPDRVEMRSPPVTEPALAYAEPVGQPGGAVRGGSPYDLLWRQVQHQDDFAAVERLGAAEHVPERVSLQEQRLLGRPVLGRLALLSHHPEPLDSSPVSHPTMVAHPEA